MSGEQPAGGAWTAPVVELAWHEYRTRIADPQEREQWSVAAGGAGLVWVDCRGAGAVDVELPAVAAVVVACGVHGEAPWADLCVADRGSLDVLATRVAAAPDAALLLVQLLRHNTGCGVEDGLFAESLAYSTLQHGSTFARWLADRRPRVPVPPDPTPAVRVAWAGGQLLIRLNRPARHNAYGAQMRDELCAALELLALDDGLGGALVTGAGRSFCAGGDLDEFGTARDAGRAHAVRMTRSAARWLHRLRGRVTCRLHGACIGAGIELPAFVDRVVADPGTFFELPEVGMGLVPGAGGTVSILRRIGRQRLAWMALSGARIDAATALAWGLIDAIEPVAADPDPSTGGG